MYFLERKEPCTMSNILGGHSMPVHTYRWKQIAVCEQHEPLEEVMKCKKAMEDYRIISNIAEENAMTLPELTTIIRTADENAIKSELKRLGYIDCAKHKQYKNISLTDLFNGDLQETDDYAEKKGKRTYQGGIITAVKGL